MATERMKKLLGNPLKNAARILDYKQEIKRKSEELKLDMAVRQMILNRNHMICIPADQGLTGAAIGKAKTIYYNDFAGVIGSHFYPETDNIKSFKNITSFLFIPTLGHDLLPNGVL